MISILLRIPHAIQTKRKSRVKAEAFARLLFLTVAIVTAIIWPQKGLAAYVNKTTSGTTVTTTITFGTEGAISSNNTDDQGYYKLDNTGITEYNGYLGVTQGVRNETGHWLAHNNALVNSLGTNSDLVIENLQNGDKVIINYAGGNHILYNPDQVANQKSVGAYYLQNGERKYLNTWENLVSGTEYYVTAKGNWIIRVDRGTSDNGGHAYIGSIVIVHENVTPSFSFNDESHANFNSETGKIDYDITQLNFTEPTYNVVPSTAHILFRSGDPNIAVMDENKPGDVLFVNTGSVNIIGTLKTGTDIRDNYSVNVYAPLAEYVEDGTTYTLTSSGKLQESEITAINGIRASFGSNDEITLVVEKSGHLVAYCINKQNGWRHKYPNGANATPTNGTFFKFEALSSGKLSFGGVKDGDPNTAVLVDATDNMSVVYSYAADVSGYQTAENIQLTAGHVYYLYGNVPDDGDYNNSTWSAFHLSWFKYESDFKLLDDNNEEIFFAASAAGESAASNLASITGVTSATAEVVGYVGDITHAEANATGLKLNVTNIQGTGGAIRIKVTSNGSGSKYFTLTVPYNVTGSRKWDFRTTLNGQTAAGLVEEMKTNATSEQLALSGITRTYKVSRKEDKKWAQLIDPILAVKGRVQGDNGFYMGKTAGLLFVTGSSSFGAGETMATWSETDANGIVTVHEHDTNYGHVEGLMDADNDLEWSFPYTVTDEAQNLWMKGASTIYFPGVKPNQYIRFWSYRHDVGKGEQFKAYNLVDLDGKPYTDTRFQLTGIANDNREDMFGPAIFRVPSDYEQSNTDLSKMPAIRLDDAGWCRVYMIEVLDDYETTMILTDDRAYPEDYPVTYDNEFSSIVIRDGQPVTRNYGGYPGPNRLQNGQTCEFSIEKVSGNVVFESEVTTEKRGYKTLTVNYKSGNGIVKITQKENRSGFIISKKDTYIAVGELNTPDYPCTWDFTTYNMFQGESQTKSQVALETDNGLYGDWEQNDGEDVYALNFNETKDVMETATVKHVSTEEMNQFAQGSELTGGTTVISETQGLGIARPTSTGTVTYGTNTFTYDVYDVTDGGIVIDGNSLTGVGKATIPNVTSGMYVFVKSSAAPTAVTGATMVTKYDVDAMTQDILSDVSVYKVETTGDVDLSFAASTDIYEIGVTDQFKQVKNTAGKTTESRAIAIDYKQTNNFVDSDLHAYRAYNYVDNNDKSTGTISKEEVGPTAANQGLLLFVKEGGNVSSPLFVPAVNNTPQTFTADENKLVANVTAGTAPASTATDYYYVFSNIYYDSKEEQHTSTYGFYKVNQAGTLKANMAYLHLDPTADQVGYASEYVFLDGEENGETGIENVDLENGVEEFDGSEPVFYDLNGVRMNGVPSQRGIYIVNGKKVYVK